MSRGRWLAAAAAITVALLTGAESCESQKDAPRGVDDTGPADVLRFPDGFSNVAHKCDGPNMVYSSSNEGADNGARTRAAIAVIRDERCAR